MKKYIQTLFVAFVVLAATSCSGNWLDVNQDPNVPTHPNISQLLTNGQRSMSQAFGQGFFIGNNLSSYTHHLVSREVQNYGMMPGANNPQNTWASFYTNALRSFEKVIELGDAEGNVLYSGIARTLLAFSIAKMVDLWGDIPFSEANIPGLVAPSVDPGEDIYNAAFKLLDEALANFRDENATNVLRPGNADVFYGGDVNKWIRLNNTIQLKLLLNTRNARSYIPDWQPRLTALMGANNFMRSGEDFEFMFTNSSLPEERHPAFVAEWVNAGTTYYISPFFYEMMMGLTYNNIRNPFAGIEDPRTPYFFFRQLAPGTATAQVSYRHGTFLSIFFADDGPNANHGVANTMTKVGQYVAGGRFDDGAGRVAGETLAASAGSNGGVAPFRLLSYHTFQFMLAELAHVGAISGSARTYLQAAMEASIAHVNTQAGRHPGTPLITNERRDEFIGFVLGLYDGATTDAAKLEIIMSQKWIANFFVPTTAYTDFRRTGFPVLFNPANTQEPGYGVNPTPTPQSLRRVPLMTFRPFPRSLYYPQTTEVAVNPNLTQKTNLATPFVFWDR